MKKGILLTRAEMKKVFGGLEMMPADGCRSDSECGTSGECCPDNSSTGNVWKCQRFSYATLPNGETVPQFCGGIFLDV